MTMQTYHKNPRQITTKQFTDLETWLRELGDLSGIVYEPFSGSGTTLIACERLNRVCRAVEISPAYVAVAIERWAVMTGQTPVLLDAVIE